LAFLACAAARLMLVEEGCMTIDEAFDPPFVETFRFLGRLTCYCDLERMKAFDRIHRQMRERELQDWRFSSPPKQEKPRPAASTIDAYRYVVKQGDPERLRAWLERHPEIKPEEHS
jgi:hypothetical protein